jgi:glutathione-regulated potassium-efflux system ancillary protein KefC
MGWERHEARTLAMRFRAHNVELTRRMAAHFDDEARLIAIARQGRQQLESMWAQERSERQAQNPRAAWSVRPEVALAPEQRDQGEADGEHHDQGHPQPGG